MVFHHKHKLTNHIGYAILRDDNKELHAELVPTRTVNERDLDIDELTEIMQHVGITTFVID